MTRYDWREIRRFYELGNGIREAQARYGFSNGAWAAAVARGDVEPRPGRPPGKNGATRAAVVERLAAGMTKAEVARDLGISKASVSRHAARGGVAIDERCRKRYDWAAVQRYYDAGHTISECQAHFGFARSSVAAAQKRGDLVTRARAAPVDTLFVDGVRRDRGHLKKRLVAEGLIVERCAECGLSAWRGKRLALQLHHLNGNGLDNSVGNLVLLCANCHSQTDNWAGRNARRPAA